MKPLFRILLILALCLPLALPGQGALAQNGPAQDGPAAPTFAIQSVTPGVSVTIQAVNFPARTAYDAYMGPEASQAADGLLVGSITSGPGGAFTATFRIPAGLAKEYKIGLRLQAASSPGVYVYNWFYNDRAAANRPAGQAASGGAAGAPMPSFAIAGVKPDQSVTVTTYNFPAKDRFQVLMGYIGTRGVDGIPGVVIDTGKGGAQSYTFQIPPALFGQYAIAIRLQSISGSGYYAYNWFPNRVVTYPIPGPGPGPVIDPTNPLDQPGYGYFPTFSVVNVLPDQRVTILAYNLPPKKTFQARMGPMGTRGIGGLLAGTFYTGEGGMQTLSFNIPIGLYTLPQIAIRIQASDRSGYYAYNWFYNH